ncbi:36625_t:CDS:1 [Gigaspora margarita]|uniref:36625_t:CDS:1 n=1 Tax=Gigaspora margarita TaxID=4874 RepID=A0ABN7UT70_GIGMA|nr:36625_t:CDS:1 [Gigaspora margarita]
MLHEKFFRIIMGIVYRSTRIRRRKVKFGYKDEKYVDEFVVFLCDQANFDDGKNLIMTTCALKFEIDHKQFVAYADREGRIGTEIMWMLCEDKFTRTKGYKKGGNSVSDMYNCGSSKEL